MSRQLVSSLVLAAALLTAAPSAWADGFQMTAFVGARSSGAIPQLAASDTTITEETFTSTGIQPGICWGLIGDFDLTENIMLELLFDRQETSLAYDDSTGARQSTPLDVDFYHVGGLFQSGRSYDKVRGFGTAALGITNFIPVGAEGMQRMSFSFSGGGKIRTHARSILRFEGKYTYTYLYSTDRVFCGVGCFNGRRQFVGQWTFSAAFTWILSDRSG